jgi:poly-gamma-glutamate synthesis protein (capsule biosynthesis protein)
MQINQDNSVWGTTLPFLQSTDFNIGNLETTITQQSKPAFKKAFSYRSIDKDWATKTLKEGNFRGLSLANNHIKDFGTIGLTDTIHALDLAGIKHAGAGRSIDEASELKTIKINGKKIGFLAMADHYDWSGWISSETKSGIWFLDMNRKNMWNPLFQYIKKVRRSVDVLILSLHWNSNYVKQIEQKFRDFAKLALQAGVDVIHGHSPHHILPIERYDLRKQTLKLATLSDFKKPGKWVIYSCGDFIDDYAVDPCFRNDIGMIVKICVNKNNQVWIGDIVFTKIQNMTVDVLPRSGADFQFALKNLQVDHRKNQFICF